MTPRSSPPSSLPRDVTGSGFRGRFRGEGVVGPDLLRIEVTSVLQRHAGMGRLTLERADAAIVDLLESPITVFAAARLLRRTWELRKNLTAFDACYVALAEAADSPLVTAKTGWPVRRDFAAVAVL